MTTDFSSEIPLVYLPGRVSPYVRRDQYGTVFKNGIVSSRLNFLLKGVEILSQPVYWFQVAELEGTDSNKNQIKQAFPFFYTFRTVLKEKTPVDTIGFDTEYQSVDEVAETIKLNIQQLLLNVCNTSSQVKLFIYVSPEILFSDILVSKLREPYLSCNPVTVYLKQYTLLQTIVETVQTVEDEININFRTVNLNRAVCLIDEYLNCYVYKMTTNFREAYKPYTLKYDVERITIPRYPVVYDYD